MKRITTLIQILVAFVVTAGYVQAQDAQITGAVRDSVGNSAVVGAYVSVARNTPDAKPEYVTTDVNGKFSMTGLTRKVQYLVKVSYVSYKDVTKIVTIDDNVKDLGTILLTEEVANLKEVKIVGQIVATEQKR